MNTITMNIADMTSESLFGIAHALLNNAGMVGKGRRTRQDTVRQVYSIIAELETRAYGGDTSELREMVDGLERCVAKQKADARRAGDEMRETNRRINIRRFHSNRLGKVTIPE